MGLVIVMRKHNNGNVTAGWYNMDLLCLGVKGTKFFFNVPEEEVTAQLHDSPDPLEEATYTLAHNIIFAGHDFAMDYDIHPHKDFETTRHILEEDNDDIPLIDIPLGTDGKPHLLVIFAKDRPEALAKLQKNAGEGNFYYSVGEHQDFNEYFLDSIPPNQLNCENVLIIETADLENELVVNKRNPIEQIFIRAELCTRMVPTDALYVTPEEDAEWKEKWRVEYSNAPAGATRKQYEEYHKAMDELSSRKEGQDRDENMSVLANKYADNPVVIAAFYEKAIIMGMEKAKIITELHGQKLCADYPIVRLSLALGALAQDEEDEQFEEIYNAASIREVIPGHTTFHMTEFIYFALIKMLQRVEEGDLPFAVKFYHLIANSGGSGSTLLPYIWGKYASMIMDMIDDDDDDEEDEEETN